jgi:hypothetical protein
MDADRQNDPADIPKLLVKLSEALMSSHVGERAPDL